MAFSLHKNHDSTTVFHFERPRLNNLLMDAVRYPLVVICAGAGYGKTSAVHGFVEEYRSATAWIQLSERDNVGARFWENYTHSLTQINAPLAKAMSKLGFPDTKEKRNHYQILLNNRVEMKVRIIVMDDFHCIEEPSVIHFMEECILQSIPPGTSVFLISRSTPRINTAGLIYRDQICNVGESDLRFMESELSQYFRGLDMPLQTDTLREIMQDTKGWAFAINLIARAFQKAPGYGGYVRTAMKTNIFHLMETEIWDGISDRLQIFLVRLSLIEHLSVELIAELAERESSTKPELEVPEGEGLIAEFEKQSAYVRQDNYINAYLIHPLFLEFLSTKQELLTEEQKNETYAIAGAWCSKNGFRIDALSYYEKAGDYQSIVNIMFAFSSAVPEDIALFAASIFDKAPSDAFTKVKFFTEIHIRTYISQAQWQKTLELLKYYEGKILEGEPPKLPEDEIARKRSLSRLYNLWGFTRGLMCLTDDIYDFDVYTKKSCDCLSTTIDPGKYSPHSPAPWICHVGTSRKGALEEYIASLTRHRLYLSRSSYTNSFMAGRTELAHAELHFYRGDTGSAESFTALALKEARDNKQHGLIHRSLFYAMRIAAAQGNFALAEQAIKETKAQLDKAEYFNRFINCDFSLSWYYCFLGMPENTVDWLKEDFSPYCSAGFMDNAGNQIKARYHYAKRIFPPLLFYIEEMKKRESFLFGRVEMLAIEACVHYKMKEKQKAFASLEEAYKTASPNEIVMPFIELGKDMRTLTMAFLNEASGNIPIPWLEEINRKSASYAKRRTRLIAEYKKANGLIDSITLSPRESEILTDLSQGLARAEIASSRSLSINTVKMVVNNIYYKLGAENLADLIRIAVERNLI